MSDATDKGSFAISTAKLSFFPSSLSDEFEGASKLEYFSLEIYKTLLLTHKTTDSEQLALLQVAAIEQACNPLYRLDVAQQQDSVESANIN